MDPTNEAPLSGLHGWLLLLARWMRHPGRISAVAPSGRRLAEIMVNQLPGGNPRVVELGAGTGVFTSAMLRRGIAAERLLVADIDPAMVAFLRRRFPRVAVEQADARILPQVVHARGWRGADAPDAVLSGLGLLSMPANVRCDILRAAFEAMGTDGRFIQFTYAPFSPVRTNELAELGLACVGAGGTLLNLPPARVFVYRKIAAGTA